MKFLRFFLPVVALLCLTTGCRKDVHMTTHEYTVTASHWERTADDVSDHYVATFANRDITEEVVLTGAVNAYVLDKGCWNPLPYIRPYYSADYDVVIGESIRFRYEEGRVTFVLEDLDANLPEGINNMPTMTFRVCVMYD